MSRTFTHRTLLLPAISILTRAVMGGLLAACAVRSSSAPPTLERVRIPEQPATPEADEPPTAASPPVSAEPIVLTNDAGLDELPASWSNPYPRSKAFVEELAAARAARAAFETSAGAIASAGDGGAPAPRDFERVNALLDHASRRYAAAFHALDATPANRIETLRDGAAMILDWSRRLDAAGLARAPAAYKTDSRLGLTYEDVADGPARRWRDDGLALVGLCIENARAGRIESAAARDCLAIRATYARAPAQRRALRQTLDAGATACGCDPGDPLCSASMNGWCRASVK